MKAQHAILRFAKYKGPTVSRIEAHNERTKETYASNPDIKTELSKHNFHPVIPNGKYRDISNRIIREAGCRVRKDSVTTVEVLITASPEFFEKKSRNEIREFFSYAVEFMKSKQNPDTYISAVVHVDEKTPHMHLCFVPITSDGRLSAKEIIGNKKRLTQWQDEFWSYMVKKYPDFERGESASLTGRTHIPPRLFKQAARLNRQKDKLMELVSEMNALNAKAKSKEIAALLDEYVPGVEELMTKLKKTSKAAREMRSEIADLKKAVDRNKASTLRQLELEKKVQELDDLQHMVEALQQTMDAIPAEILAVYGRTEKEGKGSVSIQLDQTGLQAWNFQEDLAWTPENPRLFDTRITVRSENGVTDIVDAYFGMRKVSIENGRFMLNNREYYQKLVLDQGYWEPSLLTAPTDEDFIKDIELTKAMGFNGVRKHQKVEDPRYLYHADRLGLLVWGEIGAAYVYSREYAHRIYSEWMEAVERDYNHPCIVAWTPLNESWGVQEIKVDKYQQAHCNALMYMTKSIDTSRVVMDNDGWEHTYGDLLTIHDYSSTGEQLMKHFESLESILAMTPGGRSMFADGYGYLGQPILVTEFGGVKYAPESDLARSWGYCEENDLGAYTKKYAELTKAILDSHLIQGYCYTQLTDVENEENGLLTYHRDVKIPLDTIRKINEGTWEG